MFEPKVPVMDFKNPIARNNSPTSIIWKRNTKHWKNSISCLRPKTQKSSNAQAQNFSYSTVQKFGFGKIYNDF